MRGVGVEGGLAADGALGEFGLTDFDSVAFAVLFVEETEAFLGLHFFGVLAAVAFLDFVNFVDAVFEFLDFVELAFGFEGFDLLDEGGAFEVEFEDVDLEAVAAGYQGVNFVGFELVGVETPELVLLFLDGGEFGKGKFVKLELGFETAELVLWGVRKEDK